MLNDQAKCNPESSTELTTGKVDSLPEYLCAIPILITLHKAAATTLPHAEASAYTSAFFPEISLISLSL